MVKTLKTATPSCSSLKFSELCQFNCIRQDSNLLVKISSRIHGVEAMQRKIDTVPDTSSRGQLACPRTYGRRSIGRSWTVVIMWCIRICPLYIRYHWPILFTCIAVLSRLVVKGGNTCETQVMGTNNKLLGGLRQTRKIQYGRELARGSV